MKSDQLTVLTAFIAVARSKSFTAAANQLQVSPSAVSQTVGLLEKRLGVRLLNRTTRSVELTEAGRSYFLKVGPAVEELISASESLSDYTDQPIGTLRINTPKIGYRALIEPMLRSFLKANPRITLELDFDDNFIDIVEKGYDAGIRLGEFVEKDMVAVRLGSGLQSAIVASPSYFKVNPPPKTPRDLLEHNCINFRFAKTQSNYRWEFEINGRDVSMDVPGNLAVNESAVAVDAAVSGLGIAYVLDMQVADEIKRGELVRVLTSYSPKFPGFFLYYPSRKQLPAKLRAFIQHYQSSSKKRAT